MDNIVLTFLGAFVWALFGYLSRQPEEKFEPTKLVSTFVAAIIVAIMSVGWSIPEETGEAFFRIFLAQTGFIIFIERALKAFWRRWIEDNSEEDKDSSEGE